MADSLWQHNRLKILLVEDNPGDVRLTVEALGETRVEYALEVRRNGSEGLAFLRECGSSTVTANPDLILLDLNLPHSNGHEVLEAIKLEETLKEIPVVIMTSSSNDRDERLSYELKAQYHLSKPTEFSDLVKVIKEILRQVGIKA